MEGFVQRRSRDVCVHAALMVLCIGFCVMRVCEGAAADLSGCPDALTKLLPCLPYSQGSSQVPTKDCCTNLETVHETKPQCLCALIAASVNGTQGVPKMNTTLSLGLGPACQVATKPSVCPDLLGLSPSDPLTKIFTAGSTTPSTSNSTTKGEGAAADLSSCPGALTKLLPCLPYSQGSSQVPAKDCCTNLKTVHETTPQCLCELIAASVNGTQGVPKLNTTLSLGLGPACQVATKPSVCPDLLGLSPSDPLTKIFTDSVVSTSRELQ